jgi:hypothetical protein
MVLKVQPALLFLVLCRPSATPKPLLRYRLPCNRCAANLQHRPQQMHTMPPADGAPPPRLRTDRSTRAQARP